MNLKLYQSQRYVNSTILQMALQIKKITPDFQDVCFITILKGGLYTAYRIFSNLSFKEDDNVVFGNIGISTYNEDTKTSGEVKVTCPLDLQEKDIKGRNIWLVDDCVDSGLTLSYVKEIMEEYYEPKSILSAVLVDKVKNRVKNNLVNKPDVVGFTFEEDKGFLVGCGLGMGEQFRGLNSLYLLED